MIKKDLIILETERLYITKFEKMDFRNFLTLHQNSKIMKYFDGGPKTLDQAKKRFDEVIGHQEKYGFSYYNLFLKSTNEYIGQCGLYYNYDMTVNLCYALLEKFQNNGYMTEAIINILKYEFVRLNFNQITAMSAPENKNSINVLQKVGAKFIREKTLYSGMKVFCYVINKDDFYKKISEINEYKYRKGVGAILINQEGLIYLFNRSDFTDSWQVPEGGLDENENELNGIYREIKEEIGIDKNSLTLLGQTSKYYKYNYINNEIKFGYIGQEKKFFIFRFNGRIEDFSYKTTNNKPEFIGCIISNKEEMLKLIPEFKRDLYIQVLKEFDRYLK